MRLLARARAAAAAAAALLAARVGRRPAAEQEPVATRVHAVGPFEVVTTARGVARSYFDADWRRHRADAVDRRYTLRHRGAPLPLRGRAGQVGHGEATYRELRGALTWNGAGDARASALVALVGTRDTDGDFFYFVREVDGRVQAEYVARDAQPVLLDGPAAGPVRRLRPPGGPPTPVDDADDDYWNADRHHDLTGGRLVYFRDDHVVLDLQTLAVHRMPRSYEGVGDLDVAELAVAVAPDGLSMVRPAYPRRGEDRRLAYEELTLLETDLVTGRSVPHRAAGAPPAAGGGREPGGDA
ncbi:hypothetical protein, partial [Roseisolibacter sp. H3M3-2]|uniref:hypothetical protein n=1 Tax=Roseisolibacter sp. H3M3-2 TaxID=3031323 RepID=UPI0023DA9A71